MKTWKHAPVHPDIARYVDCYWFLARESGDDVSVFPKLNPDPAAHVILAQPSLHYCYAHGENVQSGAGSHWLFPHCQTFRMDHPGRSRFWVSNSTLVRCTRLIMV